MGDVLEAVVLLLPPDAGGRLEPVIPRDGSYRASLGAARIGVRFIEGPPAIEPGQAARVMVELDWPGDPVQLAPGNELEIVEADRVIGVATVMRLWRGEIAV